MTARMLTIDQAAALLNVREVVLRRLARNGKVPCLKVGGEWRFPADIVEQLIARSANVQRTTNTQAAHVGEVC